MGKTLLRLIAGNPAFALCGAEGRPASPLIGRDVGELAGVGRIGVALECCRHTFYEDAVVVDFSTPEATLDYLDVAANLQRPIVVGTTGFTEQHVLLFNRYAERTPVLVASNFSFGMAVLGVLVAKATALLGPTFDVEILDVHHRGKRDAPSGTAWRLQRIVAAIGEESPSMTAQCHRRSVRQVNEVGLAALRGGDVVGDHTVYYLGDGERLELTHRATSRECFARGALACAAWLQRQPPGRLYNLTDVLEVATAI
jgi:4-hydroxy-tetrahydrodipicolinate reductase